MISNSQFFVLGIAPASPNNLQMYKITFSSISVNWANQIVCTSGTWSAGFSESVLSSDGSTIYSLFTFGSITYFYFCGLSVSSGTVATTRYISSSSVTNVQGSVLNGDYVVSFKSISRLIYLVSLKLAKLNIKSSVNLCKIVIWNLN